MRKFLLPLLVWMTMLPLYGQINVQLLTPNNLQEISKVLGKTVFVENKIYVYDSQDNLILKTSLCPEMAMIVDAESQQMTIRTCDGGEMFINVDTSIDNQLININGITAGDVVRVYSINGTLLKQMVATENMTTLPVDDLSAGTYLIQINSVVLKVLKQ